MNQLFSHIVELIAKLLLHIKNLDEDLVLDKHRMEMGLNIDNVIHTQAYLNSMLKEKIQMFKSYLSTFQCHHSKYLTRLGAKIELVLSIIHDDISLQSKEERPEESSTAEDADGVEGNKGGG